MTGRAATAGPEAAVVRPVPDAGATLIEAIGSESTAEPLRCPRFSLVLAGRLDPTGRATEPAGPPAVVYTPAGQAGPALFPGERGRRFEVHLGPPLARHADRLDRPLWYRDGGPPAWAMARLYREFQAGGELSGGIVTGLVFTLIAAVARVQDRIVPAEAGWVDAVREILRDRYQTPPPMKEIAATVGVHLVSLARGFRRRFGMSPGAYARQLRLEQASRDLAASGASVRQIAALAGFANTSHLTRMFKLESGLTPHTYRKLFRPAESAAG